MANDPQALTIGPGLWCDTVAALIAQAHQHATPAEIRAQVEGGAARLFTVKAGGLVVGAFVLRVDQTAEGAEGVIVSGAGNLPGVDLIATCMPVIEGLFQDVRAIRYHTARPALARRLARLGYAPSEIVARKEVHQ